MHRFNNIYLSKRRLIGHLFYLLIRIGYYVWKSVATISGEAILQNQNGKLNKCNGEAELLKVSRRKHQIYRNSI